MLLKFYKKIKFWSSYDRLGPDIPKTHWMLYSKILMRVLCNKKFKNFGVKAEFRPGAYAVCCSKISIGSMVIIRPNSMLFADPRPNGAGIEIHDKVMLGAGVHVYVHNHGFGKKDVPVMEQGHMQSEAVILKRGCWIGANSILLPGVTIGVNSVVAAGSVVTKSVPDNSLAAGNPANIIRNFND